MTEFDDMQETEGCDIAIIGMSGRFPSANDIHAFWHNLKHGVEGISFFKDDDLEIQGITEEQLRNPNFVKAAGILDQVDCFDAAFFDVPAREAAWMDPQHRLFLEEGWRALESAGYAHDQFRGYIAVYAGCGVNTYFLSRLPTVTDMGEYMQMALAGSVDHLATRLAYKLNLRGEAITVQTACSTSLAATHLACQSLLSGQCDIAVAGGVTLKVPQKTGYVYQKGMIMSPDGHCRPFDRQAAGTVSGNGLGVVVLKMLGDALRDRDPIHAVIKSSAINNDGNRKVGYTAPGVEGQADVISRALAMAELEPEDIDYIEAHGTATELGDPIEITALKKVFQPQSRQKGFCAIGAVKSNIGHLDTAAGVAGLIKTALALKHQQIPPSLHFNEPNPELGLADSPFFINQKLKPWESDGKPRLAGVSSFGIGGTNVHMILGEAPPIRPSGAGKPVPLLTFSAKSATALAKMPGRLADHLENTPDDPLADVAFTLNTARQNFPLRGFVVARDWETAVQRLRDARFENARPVPESPGKTVFMFPGQGACHVGMAPGLARSEETFKQNFEAGCRIASQALGHDLQKLIHPAGGNEAHARETLTRPENMLPATLIVEIALAENWLAWGIKPDALIGHSFGEYAAAHLAGILSLEDAINLSVMRGRLLQTLPPGAMTAARINAERAQPYLTDDLEIAAYNSRRDCTFTGSVEAITALEERFRKDRIGCRRLAVPYAYHSHMLEPILGAFAEKLAQIDFKPGRVPILSSLTGTWLTREQAVDPHYWCAQMRKPVLFAAGLDHLKQNGFQNFLEVGPEQALCTPVRQHFSGHPEITAAASLPKADKPNDDEETIITALAQLWRVGVSPDWTDYYEGQVRNRLALPTYPFDETRYWIEAAAPTSVQNNQAMNPSQKTLTEQAVSLQPNRHPVDRARLQAPYKAAENEAEQALVDIWEETLSLTGIGVTDNFFELGGDSLVATQVFARVENRFEGEITLQEMLAQQTIAEILANLNLTLLQNPATAQRDTVIQPIPRDGDIPLSFAQQRLWVVEQTMPGTHLYNLSQRERLTGALDVKVLAQTVRAITTRHESLRTSFGETAGGAVQVIHPPDAYRLSVVDLSGLKPAHRDSRLQRLADTENRLPFDLNQPPWRCLLVRLEPDSHLLMITWHHIITDGWSFGIFIDELTTLYTKYMRSETVDLQTPAIQYADFAHWQRARFHDDTMAKQLAYWRTKLNGRNRLIDLPVDRPRGKQQTYNGARQNINLPESLNTALRALAKTEGTTPYTLLLAAFQTLLHRYNRQTDILTGSPVAGRSKAELEGLIGNFINVMPMRNDFSGNPPFRELLARVKRTTLEAFSNQDLPFDKLVDELEPERLGAHAPIIQVLFNFQNTPMPTVSVPGLTFTPLITESGAARFDLNLNLFDAEIGMRGDLEFNTDLFDTATIKRILENFEVLLQAIAADPDKRLTDLEMRGQSEREAHAQEETAALESQRATLKKRGRRKTIQVNEN